MALDNQSKKDINEAKVYIKDALQGVSSEVSAMFKKAIKNSGADEAFKAQLRSASRDLTSVFNNLAKASERNAANEEKIIEGLLKKEDITRQLLDLDVKRESMARALQYADLLGLKLSDKQVFTLNQQLEAEKDIIKLNEKQVKAVDKRVGSLGEIFDRLEKNKFFGSLVNAKDALKAMRKEALQMEKAGTYKGFFGGIAGKGKLAFTGLKEVFSGIGKSLFTLTAVIKAIQTFISLQFRASELTSKIARGFGFTNDQAEKLKDNLFATTKVLGGVTYTSDEIIESFNQIAAAQGAVTVNTTKMAEGQAFMTKFLRLSSEQAGFLNTVFNTQGKLVDDVVISIGNIAKEQTKANGFHVSTEEIMREIGSSSADILANFGFSTDALANAVLQTRRLGVTLTQAKNIAGGLLDFESSITSELEAEILLGKQFNFERARALAATGDIAGATAEVLRQTRELTDEELKSPIIQKAIAKATGQTVDEFFKARKLQKSLNMDAGKYNELLKQGGRLGIKNTVEMLALEGKTKEQIEATLNAQEKYNNAISNAKDQFANLVGSGVVDMLTNFLPKILTGMMKFFGGREERQQAKLNDELRREIASRNELRRQQGLEEIDAQKAIKEANESFDRYWAKRDEIKDNTGSIIFKSADAAYKLGSVATNRERILDTTISEAIKELNRTTENMSKKLDNKAVADVNYNQMDRTIQINSTKN